MSAAPLDALAGALAAFQGEVPVIPKKQSARIDTQGGRSYAYTYADLADIAPVVMPILAKHGLAFTTRPRSGKGDRGPMLVGMLLHTSGQYVTGELPITGRTPQEIGSSLTYGRRYLLGCLTGVVTDDDDDGQLAEAAAKKRARKATAPDRSGPEPLEPGSPRAPAIQRRPRPRPAEPAPEATPVTPESSQLPAPRVPPPGTDPTPEATSPSRADPTEPMRRAMFGAVGKALGPHAQRAERLALCAAILGREVATSSDLAGPEVSVILDWLDAYQRRVVDWTYDPATETGRVTRAPVPEPPPVPDDPFPDDEPWVSHEHT